jgi:hypothetical protein
MYVLVYIRKRLFVSPYKDAASSLKYANILTPIINPLASGKSMMETYADFKEESEPFFNFLG